MLLGAWEEHQRSGGGRVTAKELLEGAFVLQGFGDRQKQFEFSADELLDVEVSSAAELVERYEAVYSTFMSARSAALANTDLYLSMANDLDVYVATSMRTREHFRQMAHQCEAVFAHPAVQHLNLRYFDPTLSAARG